MARCELVPMGRPSNRSAVPMLVQAFDRHCNQLDWLRNLERAPSREQPNGTYLPDATPNHPSILPRVTLGKRDLRLPGHRVLE